MERNKLGIQGEAQANTSRKFAPENCFPGDQVTGICMIAGPLVLVAATLVDMNVYRAAGAGSDRRWWRDSSFWPWERKEPAC
jgi:hypothetical protein